MTFEIKCGLHIPYGAVIYSVSYLNPLEDMESISNELITKVKKPCTILFDLLLSNGDEFNRFVAGYFDGRHVSYDSLKIVSFDDAATLRTIDHYYHGKFACLNRGVLSPAQRMRYAKA